MCDRHGCGGLRELTLVDSEALAADCHSRPQHRNICPFGTGTMYGRHGVSKR